MNNQLKKFKILFSILIVSISMFSFTIIASAENNVLDYVVILETKDEYDINEAARMKERLGRIHPNIIQALYNQGIVIKLINFPLTDLPEYEYLRGVVPGGWEGTGKTWEDVPGAGGNPSVARIGYSEPSEWHGTINLELHEIAHAIDGYVFDNISNTQRFNAIHKTEQTHFLPEGYFANPSEYFAEAFGYYYLGGERKSRLKQLAPETHKFIENLPLVLSGEEPVEEPEVEDLDPPTITLLGESTMELTIGDAYVELGATATDNIDGDMTDAIEIFGDINTNKSGQYFVTYSVTDNAGNNATVTRTINISDIEDVVDSTEPVITLIGDKSMELQVGDLYEELGATAIDDVDGNLSEAISISSDVNMSKTGKYIINYSVTNSNGNTATISREINVIAKEVPDEIDSLYPEQDDEQQKDNNIKERDDNDEKTIEGDGNAEIKEVINEDTSDDSKDEDELVPIEDTKDEGGKGLIKNIEKDNPTFTLPSSQTNTYMLLLIGLLLTVSGSSMLLVRNTA